MNEESPLTATTPSQNNNNIVKVKKIIFAALAVLLVLLIGGLTWWYVFGRQSNSTGTKESTITAKPTENTISNSPTQTIAPGVKVTGIPKDCGTVRNHGNDQPALDAGANQVEDCFLKSYQNNEKATLTLTTTGVDTSASTYFSVTTDAGKSTVWGYSQSYMATKGSGEKELFSCDQLTKVANGLKVSGCKFKSGSQDILIPSFQ